MPKVQIERVFNRDSGRAATIFREVGHESSSYLVSQRNGPLEMAEELCETEAEAHEVADEFINGHVTNTEMVLRLMHSLKSGPLMQAFVVQALGSFSAEVLAASDAELGGDMAIVTPEAWKACAQEVKDTLDKHFERSPA